MTTQRETVVADPAWVNLLFRVGFPLLGAVGGGLLAWGLPWLVSLSWLPMPGVFRLVAAMPPPATGGVGVLAGTGAGLVLAVSAVREQLTVTVGGHQVTLTRAGVTSTVPRHRVSGAFHEDGQLVLLGPAGDELAREASDLPAPALRQAFTRHGYRWHADGDPYWEAYRRWVPDTPGLPTGADALLRARARALAAQDREDAAQLRAELARLGVVVRDEQTRQFWRGHPITDRPG